MFLFTAARKPLAVVALLFLTTAQASLTANLSDQRSDFLLAESALKNGNMMQFRKLKQRLEGYPLLPYIEYRELEQRLSLLDPKEAALFLQRYQGSPITEQFRRAYLNILGEQGRWEEFLEFYHPSDNAHRNCLQLQALIQTGKKEIALNSVEPLWLNGRSMPKSCDPVFDAWRKAGKISPSLIWQRIELAMQKRNTGLAKYLGRLLPEKEKYWIDLWLQVDVQPEIIEQAARFPTRHSMRGAILLYGLKRLARQNPMQAESAWKALTKRYRFSDEQKYQAEVALVLAWVHQGYPDKMEKLKALSVRSDDHRMHELRIREALAGKEWHQALEWIDALPAELISKENWRYWRARSLYETGKTGQANELFRSLARQRSYHGFLAADRLGLPYNLDNTPLSVSRKQIDTLAARIGFQRASELFAIGRLTDARREWSMVIKDLSVSDLQAAAKLAQRWDWHSQAIFTLARTGYWDDLELRFPLEHERHIEAAATEKSLDKAWVLALIRQESAFSVDAVSHAGALGLMQLMPATAKGTAKSMNRTPPRREDLLTPATNIDIGTSYLKKVLERLNDNPVLAISAYNAGPHRVLRWLPEKAQEADLWVETIPFNETRRYTERVLEYSVIYDRRLGNKVMQIKQRMPEILPDSFKIRNASL